MAENISKLKNYLFAKKLRIAGTHYNGAQASPEVIRMLEKRLIAYKRGEAIFYTWEEVKERLKQRVKNKK